MYIEKVKNVIKETIYSYACPVYSEQYLASSECRKEVRLTIDDALFMETLLMKIRSETITYSIRKKKERTEKERKILSDLKILEDLSNPSEDDIKNITSKQTEIKEERAAANEGRIIRSRARWYEDGEKSSKYFLNLEKRNFESKLMPSLKIGETELSSNDEILFALTEHFEKVFKEQDDSSLLENTTYLNNTTCPMLTAAESEYMNRDITIEELGETLRKLSNNKSPGSDGFPYEFFKIFWAEIKYFLYRSLLHGLVKGELSVTQREGLITLVPKPSKPKNIISSWRPITLLNSTYKIFSATIANRLKQVLNSIIHPDQTAFLKKRFIGENTRVTYDVLWETYQNKIKGLLLSVDFKSAFDVMSWNFIEYSLRKFNFGEKFINIFRCLHKNVFSRIMYNGHASKKAISLERGCRQGDPVSCYFFIIGAEILANRIRQNTIIRGILLGETCVKVIQYADDTTFFLDGTERCLREVFIELGWFAKFSGLQPNVSKCNGMWIGSEALSKEKICLDINLNWVDKIKLLGINFEPKCSNIVENNLLIKKEAILRIIKQWQHRRLSLTGRIMIAKIILLPQITQILASLPDPSSASMKEISKILFSFVWDSKRNPIKRLRLCQSLSDNGLEMIDMESFVKSLKLKWIGRLHCGKPSTWGELVPSLIKRKYIWNYGVVALKRISQNMVNPFWKDTVSAWISFSKYFSIPDELLCNENIFNSNVTKFKTTIYKQWERNGVKFIGDLFENKRLMSWQRFRERYNICCIRFEYESLLQSLPSSLRSVEQDHWYVRPPLPARIQFLLSNDSFATFFARGSLKSISQPQSDITRIENKWIRDIDQFEPKSVWNVKRSISASRYTSFQFKLVMRILTTNTFLSLIRVQENDLCCFCQENPETLLHLFLTCSYVEKVWEDIDRYLIRNGMEPLEQHTKIFGDISSPLLTHIVTIAKYIIYYARRRNTRPCFNYFKSLLIRDFNTERYIARKNDKNEQFQKKWNPLSTDMTLNLIPGNGTR